VTDPAILAALITIGVGGVGSGLAGAWYMGGLERRVQDLESDVQDLRDAQHDHPGRPRRY
jgi:hypothetical protein